MRNNHDVEMGFCRRPFLGINGMRIAAGSAARSRDLNHEHNRLF
jgi:hypothetical protein